jgi:hypothetical protein
MKIFTIIEIKKINFIENEGQNLKVFDKYNNLTIFTKL